MAYRNKVIRDPLSGQSIRFLQTSTDTEGALPEMESTFAPRSTEPVSHYHPMQQELFTVVSGSLCVRINGEVKELSTGEQVKVPPNTSSLCGMPPVLQTALLIRQYKTVFRLAEPSYFLQRTVFGLLAPFSKLAGYKAVYKEYID